MVTCIRGTAKLKFSGFRGDVQGEVAAGAPARRERARPPGSNFPCYSDTFRPRSVYVTPDTVAPLGRPGSPRVYVTRGSVPRFGATPCQTCFRPSPSSFSFVRAWKPSFRAGLACGGSTPLWILRRPTIQSGVEPPHAKRPGPA